VFCDCTKLESITIPEKVQNIDPSSFLGCSSLKDSEANAWFSSRFEVIYSKDLSRLVLVPNGMEGKLEIENLVTTISNFSFAGCSKLDSVTSQKELCLLEMNHLPNAQD